MKHVGMPELMAAKGEDKTLRIWSIGCGTGEGPYSIAIALRNGIPALANWDVEILGTDIAESNIEKARTGLFYEKDIAEGVPRELIENNLEQFGRQWSVKKIHREWVQFETMNILKDWNNLPTFDIVLMRKVLIYLDASGKRHVIKRFSTRSINTVLSFWVSESPPAGHPIFMSVSDERISACTGLSLKLQVSVHPPPEHPNSTQTGSRELANPSKTRRGYEAHTDRPRPATT